MLAILKMPGGRLFMKKPEVKKSHDTAHLKEL
jgi:hypothetical protein